LSASFDRRMDGKDFREEAIFGNYLMRISYQEGVDHGLIVPIEVFWQTVSMDHDPADQIDDTEKKRWGIWQNDHRNNLILQDSTQNGDEQTMIFVETIEHLLALRKLDPGLPVLFRPDSLEYKRLRTMERHDLPVAVAKDMTDTKLKSLTQQAMNGTLRRFAVNTIFNVGVDLPSLVNLVRADGMGSPTGDTQIPGRTSRIREGKTVGRVYDYVDRFNRGMLQKSMIRARDYASHRWVQHVPDVRMAGLVRAMYLEPQESREDI
jgi:superfamily II DNA or RNA helicase